MGGAKGLFARERRSPQTLPLYTYLRIIEVGVGCNGSAGDKFNDYMVTNAIVQWDGTVLWLFPALIKTYCTLNVKYFPFDTQRCDIAFISWTFSGHELNVTNSIHFENWIYYNSENQVNNTLEIVMFVKPWLHLK